MSYLVLKSDTHTVAKQAKEGDSLPFGKVTFGDDRRHRHIRRYGAEPPAHRTHAVGT